MRNLLAIVIVLVGLSSCKYEDGPIMSFRSKKNRVAHNIGKYWKSDKYTLKMGQEGYALNITAVEGFIDGGDWEFNDTKDEIVFKSDSLTDFSMRIKQLQHKSMKLEGAFPFDNEPKVHEFTMDRKVESLTN